VERNLFTNWHGIRYIYISLAQRQNGEITGGWGEMVERILTKSASSPSIGTRSMTEQEPKGYKIVGYGKATIPRPSKRLYDALALKGWTDYKDRMEIYVGHEMPEWDELPKQLRAVWYAIARGQHGVLTVYGGGKIRVIDAKKTSDDL